MKYVNEKMDVLYVIVLSKSKRWPLKKGCGLYKQNIHHRFIWAIPFIILERIEHNTVVSGQILTSFHECKLSFIR